MKKRIISFLTAIAVAINFAGSIVYAHTGDIWNGKYIYNSQKDLKLRITKSAQTSLMTEEVYKSALAWNNISSNVNVSVIMETTGMPSTSGCMYVYGNIVDGEILNENTYGKMIPYDSNGNRFKGDDEGVNMDWNYVKIIINTTTATGKFEETSNPTEAAKANFIHEVGHALKLSHPEWDINLSGHTHLGYPYSVMNKGLPSKKREHMSYTVALHDKQCLTAKWGA